jgi:hypothetical protein
MTHDEVMRLARIINGNTQVMHENIIHKDTLTADLVSKLIPIDMIYKFVAACSGRIK